MAVKISRDGRKNNRDLNSKISKTMNTNMQSLLQDGLFLHLIVASTAVQASVVVDGIGTTPGRLASIAAGVVGLISVVIGWLALARSASRINSGRLMSIVALTVGLVGVILSGLHLIRSAGNAFGTGSGRLGAIVALVIGLVGMVLGGRALARSRKIAAGGGKERTY
jgi:FtsH-binding integral membrane protein